MSRSAPTLATGLLCLGLVGCALAAGSKPPSTYDLVAPRSRLVLAPLISHRFDLAACLLEEIREE